MPKRLKRHVSKKIRNAKELLPGQRFRLPVLLHQPLHQSLSQVNMPSHRGARTSLKGRHK
jgi:hypothetical protein